MILPLTPPVPVETWAYDNGPSSVYDAYGVIINPGTGTPTGVIVLKPSGFSFVDRDHYQEHDPEVEL